jgi:hypothetical protein
MPPSIESKDKLPSPTESALTVATLVPALSASFVAACFPEFPAVAIPAAMLAAAAPIVVQRLIARIQTMLLKTFKAGGIDVLSSEQWAAFVPMSWKLFQTAREGEYLHNLEILSAYLVGELKQDIPETGKFGRMLRRVEGLSLVDLRVMTLIDTVDSTISKSSMDNDEFDTRPYVTDTQLKKASQNLQADLSETAIEESLVDLMGRGFLIPDPTTRVGQTLGYYRASQAFVELMTSARGCIKDVQVIHAL